LLITKIYIGEAYKGLQFGEKKQHFG